MRYLLIGLIASMQLSLLPALSVAESAPIEPAPETDNEDEPTSAADPRAGERIDWNVISNGGTNAMSTNYHLMGTLGQTSAGLSSSTNYTLRHGYWQSFPAGSNCCLRRGDVDHDGETVNITDLVFLVAYMFQGGPEPPCLEEADVDGDNEIINISDLVYLIAYMFQGGPEPAPCP
jgi:hypothetical protein